MEDESDMSDSRVDRLVEHLIEETAKIMDKERPGEMTAEEKAADTDRELEQAWEDALLGSARFNPGELRQFADELDRVAAWLRGRAEGEDGDHGTN